MIKQNCKLILSTQTVNILIAFYTEFLLVNVVQD